jgi:hypothetical protein
VTVGRWLHRLRALLGGYFWLHCPVCDEMFGGHERPHGSVRRGETGQGVTSCPRCFVKYGPTITLEPVVFDICRALRVPIAVVVDLERAR